MKFNRETVWVRTNGFEYHPTVVHVVRVEPVPSELDAPTEWRIVSSLDAVKCTTARVWKDPFSALEDAYRVALTVRAVTNEVDFIELCEQVHDMQAQGRRNPITLVKAIRTLREREHISTAGPSPTVNRDA